MKRRLFLIFAISLGVASTAFADRQITSVATYTVKLATVPKKITLSVKPVKPEEVVLNWFQSGREVGPNFSLRNDGVAGKEVYVYDPKPAAKQAFQVGYDSFLKQDYEDALRKFSMAMKLDPGFHKVLLFIGDSHFMKGEYEKAIIYFSKLLEINPIDYLAAMYLADAYWKMGKLSEAKKYLIHSLILNVRNGETWAKLRGLGDVMGFEVEVDRFIPLVLEGGSSGVVKMDNDVWKHYVTCKNVWKNDPNFFKEKTQLSAYKLTLAEETECTINLLEGLALEKKKNPKLQFPKSIERLQKISKANQLFNLILLELYLPKDPLMSANFKENQVNDLAHYIENYVLVGAKPSKKSFVNEIRRTLSSQED